MIIGPVFINETINRARYVEVILGQFSPDLTEEERLYGWSEQDSGTAHNARMSMQSLSDVFGDRIISGGICWPAHSPDLTPCDFFLLEQRIKENSHREIVNIPAEQLQMINQNLFHQCKECLYVEGHHCNISCHL
ncbi:hypothetical protein B7P43_G05558 [Cryptotermes secundus]|uniref:Uncharacterized protein n=1 Tax=Cryptotermes secundus TaxID=105785 RepID=A0A2J7QU20_9NEOP|nr:hypothetical protein B7P43_G00123 [Cryptotermes secundus]PNF32080.1 hypothetical protein B7P43_G05558 [Cryptotermes secundus]